MDNTVKVCSSLMQPQIVRVESSQGGFFYNVTSSALFNDASCECLGYFHRGTCRHVDEVEEKRCHWVGAHDGPETCPDCGGPTTDFQLQPRRLS